MTDQTSRPLADRQETEMTTHEIEAVSSVADKARYANDEHHRAVSAAQQAIRHAINVGVALLELREVIERDDWSDWMVANLDFSETQARRYMRVAYYRDEILPMLEDGELSIRQAIRHLRGRPPYENIGAAMHAMPDDVSWEVKQLREQGLTQQEIADEVGFSVKTVRRHLLPPDKLARQREKDAARERSRRERNRRAQQLLEQQERDRAVRRAGGAPAEAYAQLRKCAASLQAAIDDTEDREASAALRDALNAAYEVEDAIVRALRIES